MSEAQNRSLSRGLDILALLSETQSGLALHEIARALELPKSSAFNLVHTLLDKGFVRCDAGSARYTLSMRSFELGAAALKGTSPEDALRQHMREIAQSCGETVHCGVLDGRDVVYIDKIESTHSIRMTSRVGARMPLYCTAMGRALLACMEQSAVLALLKGQVFEALTPHTIPSRTALMTELERVRAQGYATEREETNENVCCVGVAIRGREGPPRYAISISAPIFRIGEAEIAAYAALLLRTQASLEGLLHMLV